MAKPVATTRVWFVLEEGQRVVMLEDPKQEDMFWISFRAVALVPGGERCAEKSFWDRALVVEDPCQGYSFDGVIAGETRPAVSGKRVWLRGIPLGRTEPKARPWWTRWITRRGN